VNRLPVPYDPEFAWWQQPVIIGHPTPSRASYFDVDDMWDRVVDPLLGRAMHFDRQGNPISMRRWGELRERGLDDDGHYGPNSYTRIGEDTVGEATISTVWLGMDHGWPGPEPYRPVIFETMIFGGPHDHCMMRYHTEEEAIKGHAEAVADLTAGLRPWWAYGGEEDDEWHMKR
jgi:hypothetical protein